VPPCPDASPHAQVELLEEPDTLHATLGCIQEAPSDLPPLPDDVLNATRQQQGRMHGPASA